MSGLSYSAFILVITLLSALISFANRFSGSSLSPLDRTREEGLTDAEITERLGIFGHNRLEAKETSAILQFL